MKWKIHSISFRQVLSITPNESTRQRKLKFVENKFRMVENFRGRRSAC